MNKLASLGNLAAQGRYPELIETAIGFSIEEPKNLSYLDAVAYGYFEAGWRPLSLAIYSYIKQVDPKFPGVDNNIARVKLDLGYEDESLLHEGKKLLAQALKKTPGDAVLHNNLSSYYIHEGEAEKAIECAASAISLAGDDKEEEDRSKYNFGIANLMARNWEKGWWGYDHGRVKRRVSKDYGVPLWDGTEGQRVVVVGEQGIGDELSFASMIPDLQKDCDIIIDSHPRLADAFRRTFKCPVYPTRKDKKADWLSMEKYDAYIQMASLGAFYRKSDEDFPGTPYLMADPERRVQWRALLDSLSDKPKIGIAWTGGVRNTFTRRRSLTVDDIAPILEYDAEWISLQYSETQDIPDFVHHWPRAVESFNYDDTLALLAELDLIVTVQTAVVHAAGGLGKKVLCMVPDKPQWRYGGTGSDFPWCSGVKLFRKDKEWPIKAVCDELQGMGIKKTSRQSFDSPFYLEE